MNAQDEQLTDFERRSRQVLEESVLRIDSRVRSRLNQARQAAVEAAAARRRPALWRFFGLVPTTAGAVAATLIVAMFLWHRGPEIDLPLANDSHPMEDLDLLADGEGLDILQDGDGSGSFYEWAADQSEANGNETAT
jgi:DNA-binding transcriptional LysR family regulator